MKNVGECPWRRSLALAAACLLSAAACRSSSAGGDDPTISIPETSAPPETTVAATTTPTLIPLDQDPPVIDLAYAQRVLNEISRLDGEVSRILYRDRALTPEFEATLLSYLDGDALDGARRAVQNDLRVGFDTYRDPPGDPVVTVRSLASGRPGCMAIQADSDFGPRYKAPVAVSRSIWIVLQRNPEPTPEFRRINPSNWVQTFGGTSEDENLIEGFCR